VKFPRGGKKTRVLEEEKNDSNGCIPRQSIGARRRKKGWGSHKGATMRQKPDRGILFSQKSRTAVGRRTDASAGVKPVGKKKRTKRREEARTHAHRRLAQSEEGKKKRRKKKLGVHLEPHREKTASLCQGKVSSGENWKKKAD